MNRTMPDAFGGTRSAARRLASPSSTGTARRAAA